MTDMITNLFLGFILGFVVAAYILNPSFKEKVNNMFNGLYGTKGKKGKGKKGQLKKKVTRLHE